VHTKAQVSTISPAHVLTVSQNGRRSYLVGCLDASLAFAVESASRKVKGRIVGNTVAAIAPDPHQTAAKTYLPFIWITAKRDENKTNRVKCGCADSLFSAKMLNHLPLPKSQKSRIHWYFSRKAQYIGYTDYNRRRRKKSDQYPQKTRTL
jgi:hypothetical protein